MSSRVFRIFLSSTFGDFQAEREALRARVWPKLEHYCQSKNTALEVVDLRWGVSEADGLSHETLRICLDEIAHCQNLSPKPNFLMLIGDRYGWRPLPTEIPVGEFDAIAAQLAGKQEELELINRWYRRDDNAIPPHFKLLPRDEAHQSAAAWSRVEGSLIALLREAVQALGLTPERRERYFLSATHLEIVRGVLAIDNADEHVFAFIRNIEGIESLSHEQIPAGRFTDFANDQHDKESAQLRTELRAEIANAIPAAHRYNYQCQWTGEQKSPISTSHIDTLCADVESSLRNLIDRQLETLVGDQLDQEIDRHQQFASERAETFIGRENEIIQLQAWVKQALTSSASSVESIEQESEEENDDDESESQPGIPPLIIHGPGGVGKSAFMARALAIVQPHYPQAVIIRRFIGASPQSINLYAFLSDLLREIARRYGKPETLPEGSLKVLIDELPSRLAWATAEQPLVLAIDALDQFDENFEARHHQWLPREIPQYVAIVMSVLDGPIYEAAHQRYVESTDIKLPVFTHNEGGELLDATLLAGEDIAPGRKRRLSSEQRTAVLNSFAADGRPLYLKIAASFVRRWPSWMHAETLPDSLEGLIRLMVARLHKEHGATIADRALDYLSASRFGVSDNEMRELLWRDAEAHAEFDQRKNKDQPDVNSLPPVIWSRIYFELAPYLTAQSIDGALLHRFFHRVIGDEIAKVCLADDAFLVHSRIADYFAAQPLFLGDGADKTPNLRKLMEEPWQRIQAGELDKAETLLTDFDFAMAKCQANRFDDLLKDYRLLVAKLREQGIRPSQRLAIWVEFIRTKAHILRRGNDVWPSHKILLQLAMEHADDSPVTLAAEEFIKQGKCNWAWLKNTQRPKAYFSSQCIAVLEGHTTSVDDVHALADGRLLSLSRDGTLRLWDSETGATLAVLEGDAYNSEGVYVLGDGCVLSLDSNGALRVLDGETGTPLTKRDATSIGSKGCLVLTDGRILSWDGRALRLCDGKSGASLVGFEGHIGSIRGAQMLADGRILSWSDDGTLRLWDGDTGTPLALMEGHTHRVHGVHVLADGRLLSWSMDRTLRLWNSENRDSPALKAGPTWSLAEVVYSHDRMFLYSPDEMLCIRDGKSGAIFAVPAGHSTLFRTAWVLADERVLTLLSDGTLLLGNGKTEETFTILEGYSGPVLDVHVLADGRFVTQSSDETLCLWGGETVRPLALLEGHTDGIEDIHILPNDRLLSCSPNGVLRIWNSGSGALLAELDGHTGGVNGISAIADGRLLSWSADATIRLWDGYSGAALAVLNGHTDSVNGVCVLPDGRLLSWSDDGTLRLWDSESGTALVVLDGHDDSVTGADLLADGRILSCSDDDTLRIWDGKLGMPLLVIERDCGVDGVQVLTDGRFLSWSGGYMLLRPGGEVTLFDSNGEQTGQLSRTQNDEFVSILDAHVMAPKLRGASDGVRVAWPIVEHIVWMDVAEPLSAALYWHSDPREVNAILSIASDQCMIQKGRSFAMLQRMKFC